MITDVIRLTTGLLVLACLCSTISAHTFVNQLDKPFDFHCPDGQFLSHIYSVHNNHMEDRMFELTCKDVPVETRAGVAPACFETSNWVNDFDQPFNFKCPTYHFITGMASIHDNHKEDRRFKIYCCSYPETHMQDCKDSGWRNDYDQVEDFTAPDGYVTRGIGSIHDNHKDDVYQKWVKWHYKYIADNGEYTEKQLNFCT